VNLSEHPYLLSVLLGIVEGLTEFLPVSSTAHLRILKPWAGISLEDPYWKMYDVVIQLGAILAVVVYFRRRILAFVATFPRGESGNQGVLSHPLSLVMLAFVVTAVPAFLLSRIISENLESLLVIGLALLVGGVVMWVVDVLYGERPHQPPLHGPGDESQGKARHAPRTARLEDMNAAQAAWIGAIQILSAVFPGVSRSMSTIAAGQIAGLTRSAALEFSFFVSIPVMFAACVFDLLRTLWASPADPEYLSGGLSGEQWGVLATGFTISFLVAWGVIAWFMAWVRRRGFVPFAIYRIVLGAVVTSWALSQLR
jgi:undecaprenyl-diphosphatase